MTVPAFSVARCRVTESRTRWRESNKASDARAFVRHTPEYSSVWEQGHHLQAGGGAGAAGLCPGRPPPQSDHHAAQVLIHMTRTSKQLAYSRAVCLLRHSVISQHVPLQIICNSSRACPETSRELRCLLE